MRQQIESSLRWKGRVITGWWDGQPIHRAMTIEEQAELQGLNTDAVTLGISLLASKDYKPNYPL